jgi:hypothetical protein
MALFIALSMALPMALLKKVKKTKREEEGVGPWR